MNIYIKSFLYLIIFSLLHFGYDLTGWAFLVPFCGTNESVFQHLKMAFWSYFFTSIFEYFLKKGKIDRRDSFLYSRFFSMIIIPWFIMLTWYLVPAIFGKIEISLLEVSWAIFVTYFSAVMTGKIEKNIEEIKINAGFKIVIIILFVISAFLYVRFTYQPPWIDVFINPEGL